MMERRAILIRGIVQGVGFRPFVYNLAVRLGLGGFVKNQTGTVCIEVEGEPAVLERFLAELADRPPPLAQIEHLSWERRPPRGESDFRIEASEADPAGAVFISPDVATCARLPGGAVRSGRPPLRLSLPQLHQLRAAADDHHRRPLRPRPHDDGRLPHVRRLPGGIRRPANRRFHAQPTACAACGPRLELRDAAGQADRRPPTRSPCSPPPCATARSGR